MSDRDATPRPSGRFWTMDLTDPTRVFDPAHPARFGRLASAADLAGAVDDATIAEASSRLARGCFGYLARLDSAVAAYGWVSFDEERIGEQGLRMRLPPGEAYIWDCVTLPGWRRQGLYTALLVHILGDLRAAGLQRAWIGADLSNQPSQRGIARAGFQPVADLYDGDVPGGRLVWLQGLPGVPPALLARARQMSFGAYDQPWALQARSAPAG
jgi:ribosomal protein S18 acetylase RimI-like enzyme